MLQISFVKRCKSDEAWQKNHDCNIVYCISDGSMSEELRALRANSYADAEKFVDGSNLENLANALTLRTEKDASGNDVKVSCLAVDANGNKDWIKTLANVNSVLTGVIDPTAFGFSVPASEIMGDEKVIALVDKSGMEIPNVPCIGHGKSEEEARQKAIAKQRARWNLRISKGNAHVIYAKKSDTME